MIRGTLARATKGRQRGRNQHLSGVEPRPVPPKPTPSGELGGQVTSRVEVEGEVERLLVVERVVEADNERVRLVARTTLQNRLLRARVIEFAVGEDLRGRSKRTGDTSHAKGEPRRTWTLWIALRA